MMSHGNFASGSSTETGTQAASHRSVVVMVSFLNTAGAQLAALRVARGLASRGWSVELWFLYRVGVGDFSGLPMRVIHEGANPTFVERLKIFMSVSSALRRVRPEAVLTFLPFASVVGQTAAFLSRIPVRIASLRSPPATFRMGMRILDKLCGSTGVYTGIVAVSDAVAQSVHAYPETYRQRLSVIHNGVQTADVADSQSHARESLGFPPNVPVALVVGRLTAQKNHTFILDIASKLNSVVVVCVGDGPDRVALEHDITTRNLGERLKLIGDLPFERMPAAYRAADFFLQPSVFEGQSNALLEAMAAGLPVVVSDVPTQSETVACKAESWGRVLPLDDPSRWAAELERLADDELYREIMGRRAATRAKAFSVDSQIDGFETVLCAGAVPGFPDARPASLPREG